MVSYDPKSEADLRFLLTLRAPTLAFHPHQVCLPGGHLEKQETTWMALERELQEEIGLSPGSVEWVKRGPWNPLASRHGSWVEPYLGFVLPESIQHLSPSSEEVAHWDWFPLESLFSQHLWSVRTFISRGSLVSLPIWVGWTPVVWGLTAGFLAHFVRRISGRFPIEL